MSLLSDLPDDILGLISFWLNGFDNCSLWMASDSKLKQRLVNNVITDFYIKYTAPARYIWPGNFLKKLKRLSRLSLVVDQLMYHLPIENIEFFAIETLLYLKVNSKNAYKCLEKPSNYSTGPTTSSTDPRYINLNDLYPKLEYFKLGSKCSPRYTEMTIDFFRCLPNNLKTLSFPRTHYLKYRQEDPNHNLNTNIESLPRTLTTLKFLVTGNGPSFDASHLPANLTNLSTNAIIDRQSYCMIPKTLKKLKLSQTRYDIDELSPYLPTGLVSLKFDSYNMIGKSLAHLEHLEYLETYSTSKDPICMTQCPPKLKSFEGMFDNFQQLEFVPIVHGLTRLSLDVDMAFNRDFFVSLPHTLTDLLISCRECSEPFKFFTLLPKGLRMLHTNLLIIENTSALPESITDLELIPNDPCNIVHDKLPPKLQLLSLSGLYLAQTILKALPETLKSLELFSDSMILDDQFIEYLPRGLTDLVLQTKLKITDASASLYPPNLQRLSLIGADEMSDDGIAQLPRSLICLQLQNNNKLTDECIKYLPRKLIDLRLPKSTKITSKCCVDLPKYLSNLIIYGREHWNVK